MGCYASTKSADEKTNKGPEPEGFLTADEKRIIRECWALVSLDLSATGLLIFNRLFEMRTDLQKLFRRLMSQTETGEFVFDSVRLEGHATMVMKYLGQAVEQLDQPSSCSQLLVALGQKHALYNVKPDMLPFLWPAIRDGLRLKLGDSFGLEAELAWKHLYDYMSGQMAEGINLGRSSQKRIHLV